MIKAACWAVRLILIFQQTEAAVVLQYHHIDDRTPEATSTSPSLFKQQMEFLQQNGFQVVPLEELLNKLKDNQPVPELAVAITFDDGYRSVYETAYPLLRKEGWPFTVFINPEALDQHLKTHVSWRHAREMVSNGATIGNHGLTHAHLIRDTTRESEQEWRKRIQTEVDIAESRIQEEIGHSPKIFAYPYGEFNQDLENELKKRHYFGLGQQSGALDSRSDWQGLPRFPASNDYGQFPELKDKLFSRPLTVELLTESPIVDPQSTKAPVLELKLHQSGGDKLNCYGGSQGRLTIQENNGVFRINAKETYKTRRFRYNCTLLDEKAGSYYWYSYTWINPSIPE